MQKFTFHRQVTGFYTDQQIKLSYNQDELLSFIGQQFSKENFRKQIKEKANNFSQHQRQTLVSALKNKYSNYNYSEKVRSNINSLLSDDTFTITTGHQLSLFTGPIYLIYKIIHVIRLTEELKNEYPENNFVPVFWMASEDHDFEEIQSVEIFNTTQTWNSDQKGPVGRFENEGLETLKKEVLSFFENQTESEVADLLEAYNGANFGEATFKLIHKLFDTYGLIILDGDDPILKREFIPTIEKELKEQFSYHAVHKTNQQLEREGLKPQVNPREINLFYIDEQIRERILHLEDGFFIEGKGKITEKDLLFELHQYPERFSPNVVLRPVYQETILPNLCYVGGVGEISYWLQLKSVFDGVKLTFPMIQIRSSILWIDPIISKKMAKVALKLEDLFIDVSLVKKKYLQDFASEEVDFKMIDVLAKELKEQMIEKIVGLDEHLEKYAQSEAVKLEKQIEAIKEKLVRVVKQRHEVAMKTIDQVFERVFPNNAMQERSLNLFSLCPDGKVSDKIEILHRFIDPFDPDFIIIRE